METLIIASMFFIPGVLILLWIGKRKFNRRNVAGLEGFSSYEKSLLIRLIELINICSASACSTLKSSL